MLLRNNYIIQEKILLHLFKYLTFNTIDSENLKIEKLDLI